jgi:energy-converting hydrogenase Eha subunit A
VDKVRLQGSVKAGIALVVAILAALTTAVTGKTDFSDIDTKTWLIAAGAVLASGALTAFVQNVVGVAGGVIKAVIGAFGAAITALITAYDDNIISPEEKLTALSAFVIGLSLVYQIPDPAPADAVVQPVQDVGRASRGRTS